MYEEGLPDSDIIKLDSSHSVFSFKEDTRHIQLDPTLENVVDIQEFLNSAIPTLEAGDGPLIIDNYISSGDLDISSGHTPVSANSDFLDISKVIINAVLNIFKYIYSLKYVLFLCTT